jgi:outer membrane protein OmpA-like peptidoglycan-associated protein
MRFFLVLFSLLSISSSALFAQKVTIDTVAFNTPFDDYGVRLINGKIAFVSAAEKDINGNVPKDEVSLKPFSDVFILNTFAKQELKLTSASGIETSVNSSLNDGPVSIDQENEIFFFTNNSGSAKNKLGIYYSLRSEGKWSNPFVFPLNNDQYNVTHPFFDPATKRLYFATNMGKKKNDYDIYYSVFTDANWSSPVALDEINSDSTECFPVVFDGRLYFSSTNTQSLGGLDNFELKEGVIANLGEPINSKYDDLSVFFLNDSTGYFASNRSSAGKQDDIYTFLIQQEPPAPAPVVVEIVPEVVPVVEPIKPRFNLKNVTFAFDKSYIDSLQKTYLNELAVVLKERADVIVIISGHTDNTGSASYNNTLSRKRAEAVRNYLVKQGIPKARFKIEYMGLTTPIAPNDTREGRALNRRVEFKFFGEIEL